MAPTPSRVAAARRLARDVASSPCVGRARPGRRCLREAAVMPPLRPAVALSRWPPLLCHGPHHRGHLVEARLACLLYTSPSPRD
eukprot:4078902-Alexandrium_andersonii.AAC.1